MSKMKNRRVWGIQLSLLSEDSSPYINYGENRYGYISWKDFLTDLPTIKIPKIGPRGGEQWIDIKQAIVHDKNTYNLTLCFSEAEFLKIYLENTFVELKEQIIVFKEGSYLLERMEFYKRKDGFIQHTLIRTFKGAEIKFNTNGDNGFSVWKNKRCLEDRFFSIDAAEAFIDKGGLYE